MRVIIDTNVLMSALYFGGLPGRLLSAWAAKQFTLVLSPEIFEEYRRVGLELERKDADLEGKLEPVLALISMNAMLVRARSLPEQVCEDKDDDKFLACAAASRTRIVVSGDKQLIKVSGWQSVEILTPRQFYSRHLEDSGR